MGTGVAVEVEVPSGTSSTSRQASVCGIEETAIATAFKGLADRELRELQMTLATARANNLPVLDLLDEYRQTLEGVLAADR